MNENIFEKGCVKITKDHKLIVDMDDDNFDVFINNIFVCSSGIEISPVGGDYILIRREKATKDFWVNETTKRRIG